MKSITTDQWKRAGLSFELWLRYAQATKEIQEKTERLFAKRYSEICGVKNESSNINSKR